MNPKRVAPNSRMPAPITTFAAIMLLSAVLCPVRQVVKLSLKFSNLLGEVRHPGMSQVRRLIRG
jgi:hypothetical protein